MNKRMKTLVTIKDIAKIANVSHTTVSRALNNSPLIKEDTKLRIMKLAEQLHYTPNYSAKSLVMKKSYTIGLFFTSISSGTSSSFLAETVKGVNSVISEDFNMSVRGIDNYKDFTSFNNQRFDGIILMSQSDSDSLFIYHILQQNIPLVVLNRQVEGEIINILSNDREGSYEVVHYLIEQGHKKIGIIEGKEGFRSAIERREGYLKAMLECQLQPQLNWMQPGEYDMKSGYEAMNKLLALENCPTAVFCSNDDMAIGAMNAIFAKNLKVPEDISIVGFDDIGFSQYTTPRLTTVKRPIEKISVLGAQKLLGMLNGEPKVKDRILVNTKLQIRQSVRTL